MERAYIFQKLLFGVALLGLLGLVFPKLALPHANAAAAQTLPAISMNTSGARDARTFESDKALDAACRKSGQDQAICLCVTHVMKYEHPNLRPSLSKLIWSPILSALGAGLGINIFLRLRIKPNRGPICPSAPICWTPPSPKTVPITVSI